MPIRRGVQKPVPLAEAVPTAQAVVQPTVWWEDVKGERPSSHAVVYAASGSRKSTFAATYPAPRLVLGWDPWDQMTPYYRDPAGGIFRQERQTWGLGKDIWQRDLGLEITDNYDRDGNLVCRVEHYQDPDPDYPTAYYAFTQRMPLLPGEYQQWGTIILDSVTFCQNASLSFQSKIMNPGYKDPRLWYMDTKRDMVGLLWNRLAWASCNVVVVAHATAGDEEFSEGSLRAISIVGTLKTDLPAGYGEVFHINVIKHREGPMMGQVEHQLQTRSDGEWFAKSQIQAPNPCALNYEALWATYGR